MTIPSADIVKVVWSGTGTASPITLGAAVAGFTAVPSALNGLPVSYSIEHQVSTEREAGKGIYTHSGTTLTRERITGSTNAGAVVNFSVGTKHVRLTALAEDIFENRATVNPTSAENYLDGYVSGRSRWLNTATDKLWICLDDGRAAAGVAVWDQIVTVAELGTLTLVDDSVTNAKLANMAAWTVKVRNATGVGDPSDANLASLAEDTPGSGDFAIGFAATGELRKFDFGNLGSIGAPFTDVTAVVKGSVDPTKLWRVEVDGFTAGTTRILTPANRDWAPTVFGEELAEIADAAAGRVKLELGVLAVLDEVTPSQHFNATGTPDITVVIRGDNSWGKVGASQLANTAVTPGSYTSSDITVDAQGRITAAASGSAASSGTYSPVNGTAAGDNVTSITTARAGQTIHVDQNLQLENDVLAGRWWVIKNVHATNSITITAEATGLINGLSTRGVPANGGEIMLRCFSNAGTAPQCFAEGDDLTVNLSGRQLVDAELIDYSETSPADTSFGGGDNLNFALGPIQAITLTSNVTSPLGIDNPPATGKSGAITVIINHGTGPFTWAHPANTDWGAATPPTMSSGASDVDILTYITRDGGTNWFGFVGGLDFG